MPTSTRAGRRAQLLGLLVTTSLAACACTSGGSAGSSPKAPTASSIPANAVAGYLFQDRDGDGSHDSSEELLGGWVVRLLGTGPLPLAETKTGDDGSFRFDNVDVVAGSAHVEFSPVLEGMAAAGLPDDNELRQTAAVSEGRSSGAIAVRSYRLCDQLAECPDVRLPDLKPLLSGSVPPNPQFPGPKDWYLDTKSEPGHVLMRFGTAAENLGPGILDVVGLEPNTPNSQPVVQRVFGDSDVYLQDAGTFVYHPEHHHIHLSNFERYTLARPDGSIAATGNKLSFCLTDVLKLPVSTDVDTGLRLDIPPNECGPVEQGVDPGFADYYGPNLEDQWIDVTSVPSGSYDLQIQVDPDDVILEANEHNNLAALRIRYTNPLAGN